MLPIFMTIGLIFSSVGHAQEATSKESLFQKGLAAYQAKQFQEAREGFQKILDEGYVTPEVLHNLALANYHLDQKPLALALWRKALTLDPGFRPAKSGRTFTEAELNQRGYERDQVTQFMRETLESISIYELLWVIALLIGMVGWLWIRYGGERRAALDEDRPLPSFPTTALVLTCVLGLSGALLALKGRMESRTRATIVGATVSARSLPADDGVSLFDLRGGAEVIVRRTAKDWLQVQSSDGSSGWVKNSELFITSGP